MDNTLVCGPTTGPATVLLAHGAGAGMESPFMQHMAEGLAQQGWQVIRFEFPYVAQQRISGRKKTTQQSRHPVAVLRRASELSARQATADHRRQIHGWEDRQPACR